jgi:hypothetical protein
MDAPSTHPAGMVAGGAGSCPLPGSRGALSTPTASGGAWNVAIFCADTAGGEDARRQLEKTLAALGLRVQCHIRRWQFTELCEPSAFEAAADHALDADLVVLASHDLGQMPEELQGVLAEWLIRCGAEACPLAVALNFGAPGEAVRDEFIAALRVLTDHAHAPLHTNFSDAVVVAWDLWEWKHFPWAAAAAETSLCSLIDAFSVGQRHAARRCREASPSRARDGPGGTSRHALTVSGGSAGEKRNSPPPA